MWIGTSSWIAQLIILRILNIGVNCLSRFNTSRFDLKLSQSVGWFKFGFAFGHSSVKWADSHQIISESVNQLYCAMTKWNSDRERKKQTKGFLSNANRKFNFKSINKQLIEKGETTRRNRRRRRRRRRRGRRRRRRGRGGRRKDVGNFFQVSGYVATFLEYFQYSSCNNVFSSVCVRCVCECVCVDSGCCQSKVRHTHTHKKYIFEKK